MNVTGPNRDVLRDARAGRWKTWCARVPGTADVDNTMRAAQTEVSVRVDRLAAATYGLTTYDLATVLRTALAGTNVGVYRHAGDEYDMVVRYREDQMKTPYDLGTIKVTNPLGQQISLSQVATFLRTDSPQEILRRDRQNVATISANIAGPAPGGHHGGHQGEDERRVHAVRLRRSATAGTTQNMTSAFGSLAWALVASILLVYMILVVLYESFLTPLIRMLSIPCGVIGAFAALALTGKAINIISFIGLIMLDGLISKNGTLLIDYTNTLVKQRHAAAGGAGGSRHHAPSAHPDDLGDHDRRHAAPGPLPRAHPARSAPAWRWSSSAASSPPPSSRRSCCPWCTR